MPAFPAQWVEPGKDHVWLRHAGLLQFAEVESGDRLSGGSSGKDEMEHFGRGAALLNSRVFFGVIIRRAITDQYSLLSFFKDAEEMDYHRSRYAL